MRTVHCDYKSVLLSSSSLSTHIISLLKQHGMYGIRKIFNKPSIVIEDKYFNKHMIDMLLGYKSQGYEVVIFSKKDDNILLPLELQDLSIENEIERDVDIFITGTMNHKKYLKLAKDGVLLGPWWFQWYGQFLLGKDLLVIDTYNSYLTELIKSVLNQLPRQFAILFTPIGLLLRVLNVTLNATGDIINLGFFLLFCCWPILFRIYFAVPSIIFNGLTIMLMTILRNQYDILVNQSSEINKANYEYIRDNYAIGMFIVIFFTTFLLFLGVVGLGVFYYKIPKLLLNISILNTLLLFFNSNRTVYFFIALSPFMLEGTRLTRLILSIINQTF